MADRGPGRGRGRGRGGRGRGRGGYGHGEPRFDGREQPEGEKRKPFMGYRRMKEMEGLDPNEIILSLLNSKSGFEELLQVSVMKPDWVSLLLLLLEKVCSQQSSCTNLQSKLLNLIRTSSFMEAVIPRYLTEMSIEPSCERQGSFQRPLLSLLIILKVLLTRMPNSYTNVIAVVSHADATIKTLRVTSVIITQEIDEQLSEVIQLRDDLAERLRARGRVADGEEVVEWQLPPDEFRDKSIFPQVEDMTDEKHFLRASKVKGEFPNVETYLDVQFRLLREDFVRPLREGIGEYLDFRTKGGSIRRIQNVRLYQGVRILYPVCTHSGTAYRIKFDVSKMRKIKWENSRRLIFGSLLCLSNDEFRTLLFATVTDRKPKDLKNGEVEVRFESNHNDWSHANANEVFTMIETSAYFEAYRHVLKALQDTNETNFPFQKYIIKCELETMKPPSYLLGKGVVSYDLTSLLNETVPLESLQATPVLTTTNWPRKEYFQFDESQLNAVQAALTREFVVIQGPPGTGKTYIGLKIVEVLLRNKVHWHNSGNTNGKSPIFIVCYTNHALDQFLEGIHEFEKDGIVRVGGRSNSTVLEKCMLKNLRMVVKKGRTTPRDIFQGLRDTREEMNGLREIMDKTAADIEATSKGVVKDSYLSEFIDDHLRDDLMAAATYQLSSSVLVDWLGLGNAIYQSGGQAMADAPQEGNGNVEGDNEGDGDSEEELAVEDEGAMREQLHIDDVDDDEITPAQRADLRRRMNRAQAAEALAVNVDTINQRQVDDGWEIQNKEERKRRMRRGLSSTDAMTEQEVLRVTDVWALSIVDRWRLYRYWINKYIGSLRDKIRNLERRYDDAAGRIQEIKMQEDMHIMRNSTILGMTTTGAAKYRAALQQIKPKIVIVEEAAEVLEAHIVTTLSEGCQHLILIGDHKQLRPSANVYELATKFNLEVSLFERMVNNKVAYNCLKLQHRMRPTIAQLMEPIYRDLKNDKSVYNFEHVKGVSTDLFFIDHVQPETHNDELKSKSNSHEAKYIVALCRYLILQGYAASQVTVLTLYAGQLFKIREFMKPRDFFKGVRLTVVDNFQGEENDIILLSLVRSNPDGNIGFLSIENRVCVALSRARKGMYVIGNFDLLQSNVKTTLWGELVRIAKKENFMGKELPLYCQNHKDKEILAKSAEDFMKAPEGGCTEPCAVRLECGHVCPRTCHHDDIEHTKIKCMKSCDKEICANKHKCKKKCYQDCGPCETRVLKQVPTCGHEQLMKCQQSPFTFICQETCNKPLTGCGHKCKNKCGELCQDQCTELVTRQWPCTHIVKTQCYKNPGNFKCPEPCQTKLQCDHDCVGTCGECLQGRLHVSCKHNCGRTLVCGHACEEPCTSNCPPCLKKCDNRCKHSKCTNQCGQPCVPCKEPCEWRCRHHKCTMLCSEPCNRPRCDRPCSLRLKCGHPCIGVCGEICPRKCRICDKDKVTEIFFGDEDEEGALFVELEDCGHVFEMSGLDTWIDSAQHANSSRVDIQMKTCPRCKTPIRRNRRYGTILNQILGDIEKVKRQIIGEDSNIRNETIALRRELTKAGSFSPYSDFLAVLDSKYNTVSMETISIIKNQLAFVKKIESIKLKVRKDILKRTGSSLSMVSGVLQRLQLRRGERTHEEVSTRDENVGNELLKELETLENWIAESRNHISDQETSDLNTELIRMSLTVNYHILRMSCKQGVSPETDELIDQVGRILRSGKKLDARSEDAIKTKLQKIKSKVGGLGISEEERVQIVNAMGFGKKGHWFKCQNGHLYAIGDCGGANQESTCPECKARIGGMNHRLVDRNTFAPEMDGAAYPAWSEQANLENYMF